MKPFVLFLCIGFSIACGTAAPQAIAPAKPVVVLKLSDAEWRKRAIDAADRPRLARKVVLEAIYASKLNVVAAGFEDAYHQKHSDTRIGAFAYAATVAEKFRVHGDMGFKPYLARAIKLMQHACATEEELLPAKNRAGEYIRTRDANTWLAWGDVMLRQGFAVDKAEQCFRHALKLEPDMAEAYWRLADLVTEPYDVAYFKKHLADGKRNAERAEALEPTLHPFISYIHAYFYLGSPGATRYAEARTYLFEFLRTWPQNPHIDDIKGVISKIDQAVKSH